MAENIVIVGAGQAAVSCAARLRALSPECSISLIGDEPYLPYQRPPLSKAFLTGELSVERLALKPHDWYDAQAIDLKLESSVSSIDRRERQVILQGGKRIPYDKLVLATGSRPRVLPDKFTRDASRIYTLRGIADAEMLKGELRPDRRLLVIGGGYVGLEFAASAAKTGLDVVLVEAAERILGRVAASETADFFRELHRSHGVKIIEGVGVLSICDIDGARRASLSNGEQVDADFVVVGIGAIANDRLAMECGLETRNGVLVNENGQTSDPRIFAAGDCATLGGEALTARIESVQNAIEQGDAVAHSLLGQAAPPRKTPWFWSDQFDAKLQIAGINSGFDRTEVKAGARAGAQSIWYYAGETLLAVDAINDPVTYMTVRRILDARTSTLE
ncbi:NAD(P)/FAD-dependent oxidoreductase [Pseudomonas zhanjiangensis]|uniref:NAD(P)/FAD-dependent oxidoreductase n=1 Tax=Pseudomonas zhanjiangensis TaxID=3239015 RepID=A0ABV3YZN4_9PSED